jgi:hypothetical protein
MRSCVQRCRQGLEFQAGLGAEIDGLRARALGGADWARLIRGQEHGGAAPTVAVDRLGLTVVLGVATMSSCGSGQ